MLRKIFADRTDLICPRCLKLAWSGHIARETIMPLPKFPALGLDGMRCCHDCESADTLIKLKTLPNDFAMARIAVGNDRREQLRLPGAPIGLVYSNIVRPCAKGDLEEHLKWLERNKLN